MGVSFSADSNSLLSGAGSLTDSVLQSVGSYILSEQWVSEAGR